MMIIFAYQSFQLLILFYYTKDLYLSSYCCVILKFSTFARSDYYYSCCVIFAVNCMFRFNLFSLFLSFLFRLTGVYDDSIDYLLVLSTPMMIYLIGVDIRNLDTIEGGEVYFNPAVLLTTPTDNVYFTSIVGTVTGRIFLGGDDGCIHEILYEVFFSRFLF